MNSEQQHNETLDSSHPPTRVVCFDLDGTLLDDTIFIWQTLHDYLKTDTAQRKIAKQAFFSGDISYREWFEHDLHLFQEKGATRQTLLEAISTVRVMGGANETLNTLHERGYRLAVISGSLDLVLHQFFSPDIFAHVLINQIHFDAHDRIAGGEATPYDLQHKATGLTEIARREDVSVQQCGFVGDNYNDLEVIQAAGLGLAFNSKSEAINQAAYAVIPGGDLRRILPFFPPLEI